MKLKNAQATAAYALNKCIGLLRSWIRQLPLVGGLADCSYKDHRLAIKEFFLAFAFSTTTFWVTLVIMSVLSLYSTTSLFDLVLKTVSNGELLIFSVSFAGPILLVAMQDRSGKSPFPGAIWHVFALWAFAVVAALIFGLLKIQILAPDVNLGLNMDLRYTTVVYQKMLATADASGPKQDKDFADRWAAHVERTDDK
jgi:hypothetical protein